MSITHTFVSSKSDGGDSTLVKPSDWNASHTIADGYALMRVATVTIHDDDIKLLPTTPYEIIPAPGDGKTIIYFGGLYHKDFTAGAYIEHDPTSFFTLFLQDGNGNAAQSVFINANSFGSANETIEVVPGDAEIGTGDLVGVLTSRSAPDNNTAINLVLTGWDSPFTGGDPANTVKITAYYMIVDL